MAEARQATSSLILKAELQSHAGRSIWVDGDGAHVRLSCTIPTPRAALRTCATSCRRFTLHAANVLYPFNSPTSLTIGVASFVALVLRAPPESWLRSGAIASALWTASGWAGLGGLPRLGRVTLLACSMGVVALSLLAFLQHTALWLLLRNKAWLRSAREPSALVKAWFLAVKLLTRGAPLTFSYQSSLPKQPLPPLKATVARYLEAAAQLQAPAELARTRAQAAAFLAEEGPQLQFFLSLKRLLFAHPTTDWWEKYVYLKGRESIAINSNYYVLTQGRWLPTRSQTARAAVQLYQFARFNSKLVADGVKPITIQDTVPLCMWQYERIFATCRVPGRECDAVRHWDPAAIRHVAVMCRGSMFYLNVYAVDGRPRTPRQLQAALEEIRAAAAGLAPRPAEAAIPALTAENRSVWADARETFFGDGQNRRSLALVESALLWLSLEDGVPPPLLDWSARGKALIHGDPARPSIWFDKSLSMLVFADGQMGLNAEHSWADAPVVGHLMEESVITGEANCEGFDAAGAPAAARVKCVNGEVAFYDAAGNAAALPEEGAAGGGGGGGGCPAPPREQGGAVWGAIPWALSVQAEARILRAQERLAAAAADFDLVVVSTREGPGYGKDFIKKCRVSPDAFVQAAMQLAYFRDTAATDGVGRCENTYESSMTRLFYHGRTETVRPLTAQMLAFVAAMQAQGAAPAEKLAALQAAAARHVGLYQDAMCGEGVDRHLFGLYCVSSALTRESPFLQGALSTPWKLSTSQQPQQQTALWDIKDPAWADRISPGGGFGPVAADGYGVSYMTSGEREIFFHISARRTAGGAPSRTDVRRFQGFLFAALAEMKAVLSLALKKD